MDKSSAKPPRFDLGGITCAVGVGAAFVKGAGRDMRLLRGNDGQVEPTYAPTLTPAPAPTSTLSGAARWNATPVKLRRPYVSVAAKFTICLLYTSPSPRD